MHIKNLSGFAFFTAFLLIFILNVSAQVTVTRSDNRVTIEGKMYYLHLIKAGQTLYSVSKAYDVSEKDITKENPGAEAGLQTGQVLKIPVSGTPVIPDTVSIPPDTSFLYHEVKPGETMYSISKSYNISIDELDSANPLVINHEIQIGQNINIPRINKESRVQPQVDFTYHKVKRRETVFGIAKMYNVSEDILKKYNPELLEKFPRPGQFLKIPPPVIIADTKVPHLIEKRDSLLDFEVLKYDTVKIASKYSYYLDSISEFSDEEFNVAYLIPFNYRPLEELSPIVETGNTKDDIVNLDHESNPNDQMLASRNFLEFLEGSLLAIDSLRNEGIPVNIFIYDTKKSPTRTREILGTPELKKMDLIIGPFYSFNVEIVSEFSRLNRIPMISPLSGEGGPANHNPFFFQLNPGYKTEYDRMADYLSRFSDKNIVFIHGVDSIEAIKYNYLVDNLENRLSLKSPDDSIFFQEIAFDYTANSNLTEEMLRKLSLEKQNIVVVPETDEAFVSTVVTQLFFQLKTYNISVVGMPHWNTFQNIDFTYFHKLRLSYFTPYYFSYDSSNVKHFLKDYRQSFYSEPVTLSKKGGSYAFLGYDISYNFLRIMNIYGERFILHLNDTKGHEMMNDFHFVPVGEEGGFENRSLVLVKFFENLDIAVEPYAVAVPVEDPDPVISTEELVPFE